MQLSALLNLAVPDRLVLPVLPALVLLDRHWHAPSRGLRCQANETRSKPAVSIDSTQQKRHYEAIHADYEDHYTMRNRWPIESASTTTRSLRGWISTAGWWRISPRGAAI